MTTRAEERTWKEFEEWCRRHRLRALPAHPWTLAAYVRWCETRHPYAAVVRRVKAVARRHVLAGKAAPDRHPLVTRTLRLVERHEQTRGQRAALFPDPASRTASGKAKREKTPGGTRRRTLAATPKLVTRRPSSG